MTDDVHRRLAELEAERDHLRQRLDALEGRPAAAPAPGEPKRPDGCLQQSAMGCGVLVALLVVLAAVGRWDRSRESSPSRAPAFGSADRREPVSAVSPELIGRWHFQNGAAVAAYDFEIGWTSWGLFCRSIHGQVETPWERMITVEHRGSPRLVKAAGSDAAVRYLYHLRGDRLVVTSHEQRLPPGARPITDTEAASLVTRGPRWGPACGIPREDR